MNACNPPRAYGDGGGGGRLRPSVCLFTDSLEPSGVGEHMLTLAAGLREPYTVTFVCPPTPAGRQLLARAERLGIETLALEVRGSEQAGEMLITWLRQRPPQLFHAHAGIGWEGHHGVRASRLADVPAVIRTEHLPFLLTDSGQIEQYHRGITEVDAIICVSRAARETFLAASVPPDRVHVIVNGILTTSGLDDRRQARARLGLPMTAPLIVTVGRFTEQKGYSDLLNAVPLVASVLPTVEFLWVGSGPLETELRARVRSCGLDRHVRFLGQQDDIPQLLAAGDLFVLASRFEGLPLVVLEAMAAERPVVGTRVCGMTEAVEDGETGCLVPAGDASALAEAIVRVLRDSALAARWGAAGRARVMSELSADRMVRETEQLYTSLLQSAEERATGSSTTVGLPTQSAVRGSK